MTDRIANLPTSNLLMNYIYKTQNRLLDLQYQVSSQQKSATYSGISKSTQYLLSLEHSSDTIGAYIKNNEIMDVRLDITSTALTGISTDVEDFLSNLKTFNNQAGKTEENIETIQKQAFNALKSVEAYLNTPVGSRFAFAGGRVDTVPVDLGLTTLADFQSTFDGAAVSYPTTRDAHVENFSFSKDSSGLTNWLTFEQDGDGVTTTAGTGTITATTAQFANVTVGTTIQVSGTANNNGYYTVTAVTGGGTAIEVETRMLTDEANNAAAEITLPDGTTLDATNFTDLSFVRSTNRITVGAASSGTNALSSLAVGSTFTVSGTAENDGTYTVAALDGTNGDYVDIVPKKLTDEGTAATPTLDFTGNQTFTAADNSIAAAAGTYSDLSAGMEIDITGTVSNNFTYTISSVSSDGSTIYVSGATVTDEGPVASDADVTEADGTIASKRYYYGDELSLTHRVDENRSFEYTLNGLNPAFEKAIRAMSIIAQGDYGTEGGLDQNISRAENAIYLLGSATDGLVSGTPPYGTEETGNLDDLLIDISYQKVLISQTTESHTSYKGFLDEQIANIENSDPLEVITRLLDEQNALEASYQTLARIRQLSLAKYL